MTTKSKSPTPKTISPKKKFLTFGGLLFFGWPILTAYFSGHLFFCGIASQNGCADSGSLLDGLVIFPTIAGAVLFSVGLIYSLKLDRSIKTLLAIAISVAFSYIGYWMILFWFWAELMLLSYLNLW
ncbi:hypothetical protein [Streptomyces sp. PvR018]|uniref:hypothetical protein n=1 Tax=Streptomyces sp. PvR018 TaxID=3156442 RepID=UPI00339AB225